MKAIEFMIEGILPSEPEPLARVLMSKMLDSGLTASAAVNNVIDILLTRGTDRNMAAAIVKKVYTDITGSDINR